MVYCFCCGILVPLHYSQSRGFVNGQRMSFVCQKILNVQTVCWWAWSDWLAYSTFNLGVWQRVTRNLSKCNHLVLTSCETSIIFWPRFFMTRRAFTRAPTLNIMNSYSYRRIKPLIVFTPLLNYLPLRLKSSHISFSCLNFILGSFR